MLSENRLLDLKAAATPCTGSPKSHLSCSLRWRQERLWVGQAYDSRDIPLPALAQKDWFQACLVRSQAKAVLVDPALGAEAISLWAKACEEANKPIYLRIPSIASLPQKRRPLAWWFKQVCDRLAAALLLALISPLVLLVAGFSHLRGQGLVFDKSLQVGERGRLFYSHRIHRPRLPQLMPQLIDVLRGDLSLVGSFTWNLEDAVRLPPHLRSCLNARPGILAITPPFKLPNPGLNDQTWLTYLSSWTLRQDFSLLLLAMVGPISRLGQSSENLSGS